MTVFFGTLAFLSLISVVDGGQKAKVVGSLICFLASLTALLVVNAP